MSVYFEKSYQRGFGTYPLKGEPLKAAVREAITVGYRAFDTAQMYGNEAETGEALAKAAWLVTSYASPRKCTPIIIPKKHSCLRSRRA